MQPQTKGTVTPIASLFSPEQAQKAASHVQEKIGEKQVTLNRLQHFVDENSNLINLIKKLPDQLHHNVMVPFGKMAFFPGRLIHTNECMVLLGENYYSERTCKQAVEVLKRRDKTLLSQIGSLKAEIDDFQAEASFFSSTASEAAEGLVEIREEYEEEEEEEDCSGAVVKSGVVGGGETVEEDDEFARIMSRLNELEKEEEEEEEEGEEKAEEHDSSIESVEESEQDMVKGIREQETIVSVPKEASSSKHITSILKPKNPETRVKAKVIEVLPEKHSQTNPDDPSTCIGRRPPKLSKVPEDQPRSGNPQRKTVTWSDLPAKAKTDVVVPQKNEVQSRKQEQEEQEEPEEFDSTKAFTGLIVERTDNLQTNTHGQMQTSGSKPSRPVSRFMAMRKK